MVSQYMLTFVLLLTPSIVLHCASAAVHGHSIDNIERESDGSYRARDYEHYNDAGHNSEFDHEAILGSVKEAEEYDKLSPEESKRRLGLLLLKMDLNNDKYIDRDELTEWILKSFINLSREEAEERMSETDENQDGVVTWGEYLQDSFGVDTEEEIGPDDTGDTGMLVREEKLMWAVADRDGDGNLNLDEFAVFSNPEEHEVMTPFLVNQTLREKDKNRDGRIDFNEFVGDRSESQGSQQDKVWLVAERDKFDNELDINKSGFLELPEIHGWIIPDNNEIAREEVEHLMAAADEDHDGRLSFEEVLERYDVFVGSEATDFGAGLHHFDDEL